MRFLLTLGRVTVFDFTLFRIDEPIPQPDVVVVHHHNDEDGNDETDGPGDIFGKGN
jgi:hypothetical protein